MEVSIWDENKEKDVYFDSKKTWVGTSWDVRASELPQAVKQAVNARYPGFTIDDAEYVQTPVSENGISSTWKTKAQTRKWKT